MFSEVGLVKAVGGISKALQRSYTDFVMDCGIVDKNVCNKIFTYAYHVVSYGDGESILDVNTLAWDYIEDESRIRFSVDLSNEYKKSLRKGTQFVSGKVSTLVNGASIYLDRVLKGFDDYSAEFNSRDSYVNSQLRKGVVSFCITTYFELELVD